MLGKSRQQLIDEKMCRPGYTWNEALEKCLPAYGGSITPSKPEVPVDDEQTPETVMPDTPEQQPKRAKANAKAKAAAAPPAAPVE